jgi:hypothetical protein
MAIRHSRVFRTWIITPAGTSYEEANALALREARPWITGDQTIEMGGVASTTGIPFEPGKEYWLAEFTVLPPA